MLQDFWNSVLHWVKEADAVINCVAKSLKPGGRFVAEFGGKGNVGAIVGAILSVLSEIGCESPASLNPWYFPRQMIVLEFKAKRHLPKKMS